MMNINMNLLQWSTIFLIKSLLVLLLTHELQRKHAGQLFENLKKGKAHYSFNGSIWGADLAHIQLLRKYNKESWFLLCVIDAFSKYAWVVPLKDEKYISSTNAFQKTLDETEGHKRSKIGLDIVSNNFKIEQRNHCCKKMIDKSIQHIMKENCCCWNIY